MISVILADDHQMVLDGFAALLSSEDDIEVLATCSNGKEVISLVAKYKPHIAILDIEMPDGPTGIVLANTIRDDFPGTKVLILSMYKKNQLIEEVLKAGASGFIVKNQGHSELVRAIRQVSVGKDYYSDEITDVIMDNLRNPKPSEQEEDRMVPITKREKQVLKLIVEGYTSNQIGEELFIASSTVETHRRNLIDKTGVKNSKALISFAIKEGLLE